MIVLASAVLMFALVLAGVWTGVALVIAGFIGLLLSYGSLAFLQVGALTWSLANSSDLAAIPLFIVMGELLGTSRAARDLFNLITRADSLTPAVPALATIIMGAMISAVSGSITTVTAICTRTAYARLKQEGLPARQSIGLVASVGSLGIMFPPSLVLIIYGSMTQTSILSLFRVALVPAILQTLLFLICAAVTWRFRATKPPNAKTEKDTTISAAWQFPAAIVIVVGGFMSGLVSPVESAAVGAVVALSIALINRELSWSRLRTATRNTVMTTSMILLIVLGSEMMAATLAIQGFARDVSLFIQTLPVPRAGVMIAIVFMYVVLGTVFEGLALMVLTIPFILPAILALGYSPLWFGIMLVICIQIAELSPPVGVNLFVAQQFTGEQVGEVWRGIMPYLYLLTATSLLFIAFPRLGLLFG